ncbi:MAG: SDR family oxidoreductase [Gammaproteobacteria bacterium]|nr:SDR family oxidoreductase [Gammaproteobacteria bacterium]
MEQTSQESTKTIIITGGGRDIGRACALKFGRCGANVAVNYHSSSEGAISVVEEIKSAGGNAFCLQGDMTSEADVSALVTQTVENFGSDIHAVVSVTGGLIERKKIRDMSLDHWQKVFNLNATSFFLLTRESIPYLSAGSAILSIASQAGRDGGGAGAVAYASSKGAIMSMTRGLAKEVGPDIRVNTLCPGMIDTDFHNTFTKSEVRAAVASATPLKREGRSEEVAEAAYFLTMESSSFITGACLDINGGLLFS